MHAFTKNLHNSLLISRKSAIFAENIDRIMGTLLIHLEIWQKRKNINQIYAENEQDPERTHKKFLLVRQEGNRSVRRNMSHYNLDMIIAVPIKVTHALYLDMGRGWNYAWYREKGGKVKEVFPESKLAPSYKYRTNWITFYK